jgi:protein-disulfide isomerase
MANSADKRSPLLWVLILVVAAACMLCVLCAGGSAGMYFFFRPTGQERTSGPTIYPTSTSAPFAGAATEPMPATPTQNESVASPTSAATPDPDVWRQMGDPNAKVVIEEFADYQCPFCGEFHTDGEPRLRTEYIQTGKVRFIFRNFPVLDRGDTESGESHLAALGALCAGEQGQFWEYHDTLFENQSGENSGGFAAPHLLEFALNLGLDGIQFDQCVQTKRYESVVDDDLQLGRDRDLHGVPTFFINGKAVVGFDPSGFFNAVDQALSG